MSSHPPVPSATQFGNGADHPLMDKQVESSLPLLGDSQFELVLDPGMKVELADDLAMPDPDVSVISSPAISGPGYSTPALVVAADDVEASDPIDDEVRRYHGRKNLLLIGANVVVLGVAGYYAYSEVLPMKRDLAVLEDKRVVLEHELEQNKTLAVTAEAQRSSLEREKAEIEAKLSAKETEWANKQAILDAEAEKAAWIPTARATIETELASEIKRGDVLLRADGPRLVVELADKALFKGNDLSDGGKALVVKVGALLVPIQDKTLRVAGHTDSAPTADLVARYPTAWELSTARAAQVARALEEGAQAPAQRLVVEGYGASRPAVPGKNAAAKKRNRRVEIAVGL
jgi:chemotaxis protein MotB